MKSWLKYSLLSILLVLIILMSTLAWLISTEAGLRFIVAQAQQWSPGELKIDTLQGRLLDKISLTGLSYQDEETAMQVDSFLLNWDSSALLGAKLHVKQLHIDGIDLDLPKTEEEKESAPLSIPDIELPVQIALDDVQIKQVTIRTPGAEPFVIDSIELRSTTTSVLSLQHLQVKSPLFNAKLAGDVGLIAPHTVQVDLNWSANLPDFSVAGQGQLSGDTQKLVLTHSVSEPLEIELNTTVSDVLGALKMEADLSWQEIYWPLNPPDEEFLVRSQQGHASLSGSLDNYHFNLSTNVTGKQVPAGHWTITAQGNQESLIITKLHSETLEGMLNATGKVTWQPKLVAQLNFNADQISLKDFWKDWPENLKLNSQLIANIDGDDFKIKQLKLSLPETDTEVSITGDGTLAGENTRLNNATVAWQGVQWPLVGDNSIVTVQKGHVDLSGTPQNYQIDLKTQLAGAQIPPGHLALTGSGDLQQFTVESLHTSLLKGAVNATGQVSWQPKLVGQLNLNVEQITVKDFWKDWPDNLRVNSQLVAKIDGDHFEIKTLKVKLPQTAAQVSLQGDGTLAGEKTRFNATLAWQGVQWPLVGKDSIVTSKNGRVNLSGTPQNYKIDLETLFAGAQVPAGQLALAGRGDLQQFTVNSLHTNILKGAVNATGQVSWQPKLVAQLNLDAEKITIKEFWKEWPDNLTIKSHLVAGLDGQDFQIKQLDVKLPETAAQLSLQGEGTLDGENTRFNTTLAWQGLQWPLVGQSSLVTTEKGTLSAEGTPQSYQLRLNTDIKGKDIPEGRWQAVGSGTSKGLKLESLQAKVLEGALNLAGQVEWQPDVSWQLALKGNNLNPGSQWTEWPGKIGLDVHSQGRLKNGKLETQVKVKRVQGQLRDHPLKFQTEVAIKGDNYKIKALEFKSGRNRLTANGELGQNSNLKWTINAPALNTLLPEGEGSLSGKGRLSGPLNLPHLTVNLKGKSLVFQDKSLKSLQAKVDVNLLSQKDLHLDIVATDLSLGTTQVNRFRLQGKGKVTDHTLVASVRMPEDRFSLKVKGAFKEPRWQGQLQKIRASTAKAGYWQLQAPAELTLSATEAKLGRSCLKNAQSAKVCTQLNWQKTADTTLLATLENLPLKLVRAFLPEDSDLSGTVNGRVTANLRPDGGLKSDVLIKLSPGIFKTGEENAKIRHHGGAFKLKINENGLAADLSFKLLKKSGIAGKFNLPNFTQVPPTGEQPMQGRLKMTFADFAILPTLVPQLENTQGWLGMDVNLGGTMAAPKVRGLIRVRNAALELPDFGLELKKLNATVRDSGDDSFKMQVNVESGEEGQLEVKGKAKLLSATDWKVDFKIAGKNFEVVNMPEAWALISPNLKISMAPDHVDVTGEVRLPEVALKLPESTSSAVGVSEDVVIVNPKEPVEEKQKVSDKMAISSKVKIILGDNVTFDGAGFKSRFGGTVIASNQPGKVTVGNGELYIIDGSYRAYGQDLKIDRGRVIFTGGPIENPGLDIPAYRHIKRPGSSSSKFKPNVVAEGDVIAGVRIEGTAQSPQLILYSKPPTDESNILSYIVLGKPIAEATEKGEGDVLAKAAASLSLKGGDHFARKIGQKVGLDDVGISTEKGLDEAALMMGKALSPGLYISYGIGLFDGSQVLRMSYELTKNLTLESETGTQSGVDLSYTIER
ncbi:MAG: translocation/assembly module TamB domain-containing protein [Pseudomonadota bacterium]